MPKRACCLLVLCGLFAVNAAAEPVNVTSGAFSTQGTFRCLQGLSCSGEGTNSISIEAGGETALITFSGVDTSFTVRNVIDPVPIGRFDVESTSSTFSFPTGSNPNIPILAFLLTVTHTAPISTTSEIFWRFGPGGGTTLPVIGESYFAIDSGLSGGLGYPTIAYTFSPHPFSLPSNGSVDLAADVGAIPEPASLLLVTTGRAAALRKRRSRTPRDQSVLMATIGSIRAARRAGR